MATLKEKIAEALASGHSADEVKAYLANLPEYQDAIGAGYSQEEVWQHLGLPSSPRAAQMDGLGRIPAMIGSGLITGLGSALGLPGSAIEIGNAYLPNWMTRPIGSPEGTPPENFLPTISQVLEQTKNLGLTDRPDLAPQNDVEDFTNAASVGAGSALSLNPLALLTGVGGGLGAELAKKVAPDNLAAEIAGGIIGGMGVGKVGTTVERVLTGKQALRALEAAQLNLDSLKVASPEKRIALEEALAAARKDASLALETSKGAIEKKLAAALGQHDAGITGVASSLGKSKTLQEAGTVLQEEARNWVSNILPKKLGALWAPVDSAIPGTSEVSLDAFTSALQDINKSAGALEGLASKLKPGLPKALLAELEKITAGSTLSGAPTPITWQDVQKLRSTLGDALSNPQVIKDVGAANLDRLYATLTSDMRETAKGLGADALFDAANTGSRQLYSVGEGPISQIIAGAKASADDPLPEVAAKRLLAGGKSGASDLAVLRAEIPKAMDELAGAHVAMDSGEWTKLAPEAQAVLVPDPAKRASLEGYLVGKGLAKEAAKGELGDAAKARVGAIDVALQAKRVAEAQNRKELAEAASALRLAKEEAARLKPKGVLENPLHTLTGSTVGGALGITADLLGLPGEALTHGAIGTLVGAAVPSVVRGAAATVKNPGLLRFPLRGALAANALALQNQ